MYEPLALVGSLQQPAQLLTEQRFSAPGGGGGGGDGLGPHGQKRTRASPSKVTVASHEKGSVRCSP